MSETEFSGLTMPVFTAFGWAGEATAINFALSQLEGFAKATHAALPENIQAYMPHFGLDQANQVSYLGVERAHESGAYFSFIARPMTFEVRFNVTDRKAIAAILKAGETDPAGWFAALNSIPNNWQLRLQQAQVEEGSVSHYQDLFKDSVSAVTAESAAELTSRAAYLNGEEEKWITPIFLSSKMPSESVAAMGINSPTVFADTLAELAPFIDFLNANTVKRVAKSAKKAARKTKRAAKASPAPSVPVSRGEESFTYTTQLKALHIRKGFINLTPTHWPFFAKSARAETQEVTVLYEDKKDLESSVWRLVNSDQARVVLGPSAKLWLTNNFNADDKLQVHAIKKAPKEFEVTLTPVSD